MVSSHSPSTSETIIDRKVGPVSTHSDIETAALPALPDVLEVEKLTKSVMYILQVLLKGKRMANTASCIDVKSTGGCYRFSEFYLLFHLLTGQILAWHEHRAWITIL